MNRIYRLAWNRSLGCFVPASEVTRARGKGKTGRSNRSIYGAKRGAAAALAAAAALTMSPLLARAGPTGGQIVSGSGNITQAGTTTTIDQASQNLSLNWASFNIAPQESVNFVQPSAAAIAINRIFDTNGTQILGHLNANGQIFLINPNGVLFGSGSQVDVGGLIATTLDVSGADAGNSKVFSGSGSGSVINAGTITAASGGYVALLGNHVGNQGTISARLGTVALGAGSAVTLTFNGNDLVGMQVDQSVLHSLAENGGLVQADGGRVIMTAGAKSALLASVVNNTGVIEARTVNDEGGVITLQGGMTAGSVEVGGTLDASAPNGGNGGSIETSGAHVQVADGAKVTTAAATGLYGSWLIDPQNFTVAAAGGDITGAALGAELAGGNITIDSSAGATAGAGNINVNAAVTWAANNRLTLTAANNVNVNATITASGNGAGLTLNPNTTNGGNAASGTGTFILGAGAAINLTGTAPSLIIGGVTYTVINALGAPGSVTGTDLQGINGNLAGDYALGSNIDATATATWNAGAGFTPLAATFPYFTGVFDGLGHTITGLTVNQTTNFDGLFAQVAMGGVVQNVTLAGGGISGPNSVGALVGYNAGLVNNSTSSAAVTGAANGNNVGGLVGANDAAGTVKNSSSSGTVGGGGTHVGGLVGANYGAISLSNASSNVTAAAGYVGGLVGYNLGTIANSFATGTATATIGGNAGGLAGANYGTVSGSYATGVVTGTGGLNTGGLVGVNGVNGTTGAINTSYATGNVNGGDRTGGLVGYNDGGSITTSYYSTGAVNGGHYVGGLVGESTSAISNSYATGSVTGTVGDVGGLVGYNYGGTVTRGYATGTVMGASYVGGLVGVSTGTISQSYATGNVTASNLTAGGLVGVNGAVIAMTPFPGTITNSYSTGAVNAGTNYAGGLVGYNDVNSTIATSYATGAVTTGGANIGGLTSFNAAGGTATGSFWNTTTTGQATSPIGVGMTTAQMQTQANFTSATAANGNVNPAWDFAATWVMYQGETYPLLRGYLTPLTITVNNATEVYNGVPFAGGNGLTYSVVPNPAYLFNATVYGGSSQGAVNVAGSLYVLTSAAYSNQQGYLITFVPGTLSITAAPLTVTGETAANKVYDGTTAVTLSGGVLGGVVAADAANLTLTDAGVFVSKNAGTGVAVTVADILGGTAAGNYTLTQPAGITANITPLAVTVTGEAAANKVYDATTTATLSGGTLNGVLAGDASTVNLVQSGNFATKNIGTGIAVTATDSLTGANALNYTVTEPTGLTANITPVTLTVTGEVANNKAYDGTTNATLSGGTLVGVVAGDAAFVTLAQTGTFASKNVGTGIAVTATDTLGGTDGGNYLLTEPTGLSANITAAALTVAGETANNKVFDNTFTATFTGGTLVGVATGDSVTLTQAGTFASKNVGTGIAVTATDTLGGAGAGNYTLTEPTGLTANITPAPLTVVGETAANKVYDGTTVAALMGGTLVGAVAGDGSALTLTDSGMFATKNAGTGVAVTVTDTLGGTGAGNYTIVEPTITANISPLAVTVTGEAAANKVYDATTTATLSGGALNGVLAGDASTVTLVQSGSFATKNVGTGIAVTATDTLSGANAGNYTVTEPTGLAANITPASVTVAGETAANKVYDGTVTATLSGGTLVGAAAGDAVTLGQSGNFTSKNVGTGIAVTATDSLSGASAGNYLLTEPTGLAANITPATLTYVAIPVTLNTGQTPSALTGVVSGFVTGDTLANSTLGTLLWTTPATALSPTGRYPIEGSGLTAPDYVFVEAGSNVTALTLAAPPAVQNTLAEIFSLLPSPQSHIATAILELSPTIAVASRSAGSSDTLLFNYEGIAMDANTPTLATIPSLRVVGGGVKLPDNTVSIDE